ncbi:MAG: outer membrane beta-barrel protein, partial [Limnohabitans sp.]
PALLCILKPVYAEEASKFYVEVFGGATKNLMGQPLSDSSRAGANFSGVTKETHLAPGEMYGLRAGYTKTKNWRFDLSYYDTSNEFVWKTTFPPAYYGKFKGIVSTKSLVATGYYNIKPEGKISPYMGFGIGAAQKTLKSTVESYSTEPYAYIENGDTTGLIYRLTSGFDYGLTNKLTLNLDISALHVGNVSSGSHRYINGNKSTIGKYEFKDLALADITLGLRYNY